MYQQSNTASRVHVGTGHPGARDTQPHLDFESACAARLTRIRKSSVQGGARNQNPSVIHQLSSPQPPAPFPLAPALPPHHHHPQAGHRVSALSRAVLGLDLPPDSPRLFASLLPPEEKKAEALRCGQAGGGQAQEGGGDGGLRAGGK